MEMREKAAMMITRKQKANENPHPQKHGTWQTQERRATHALCRHPFKERMSCGMSGAGGASASTGWQGRKVWLKQIRSATHIFFDPCSHSHHTHRHPTTTTYTHSTRRRLSLKRWRHLATLDRTLRPSSCSTLPATFSEAHKSSPCHAHHTHRQARKHHPDTPPGPLSLLLRGRGRVPIFASAAHIQGHTSHHPRLLACQHPPAPHRSTH